MANLKNIDEHFVQEVWNERRFFDFELKSIDGRSIQVLKPGFWNSDEGPDFVHAELLIDGDLYVGDVEIHINSSGWYSHKHHLDPRYNRVILHVVYLNDDINLRTRLQNGKRIPTLEILNRLDAPIGDLFDERRESQEAPANDCRVTGKTLKIESVQSVLNDLGQERLLGKADVMRGVLVRVDFEQLLYEGIMEALGYTKNRKSFRELAQRVPLSDLLGKSDESIQAILFGVSGLLPSQSQQKIEWNEVDRKFVERLESVWESTEQHKKPTRMTAEQWHFAKMRPANYPSRRIPAIAQIISHCQDTLMMDFLPLIESAATANQRTLARIRRELQGRLTPAPLGYWEDHSHFGKGIPQRGTALIGTGRASDIIVNILLPIVLVWAEQAQSPKLTDAVQRLYDSYPKLQENRITQQIEAQIFSQEQPIKLISPSAKKQQGAIYLDGNFCSSKLCDLCPIIEGDGIVKDQCTSI